MMLKLRESVPPRDSLARAVPVAPETFVHCIIDLGTFLFEVPSDRRSLLKHDSISGSLIVCS